jgi:formamidopyrimidine-DNA glycosylase
VPEGHSLHRLAGQLAELVGHQVAVSSPQGRFNPGPVDGSVVTDVQAYGKHLLLALRPSDPSTLRQAQGTAGSGRGASTGSGRGPSTGAEPDSDAEHFVHVHLGMRGKWLRFSPVTGPGLKQVRLRLATPYVAWDLIAPSTCELLGADGRAALLATLGPDPLRPEADADEARRRLQAHRGSVGAALMDQRVVAGVGNVFRAEVLHACRIAPSRSAGRVSDAEFAELWLKLQAMMAQGVVDGRILTVDVPEGGDRQVVPEAESRRVYKQAVCYDCGTPVTTSTVNGRTAYACPHCQPD